MFKQLQNASYSDFVTARQIRYYSSVGPAALPPDLLDRVL